jgi:hypothetical protein
MCLNSRGLDERKQYSLETVARYNRSCKVLLATRTKRQRFCGNLRFNVPESDSTL